MLDYSDKKNGELFTEGKGQTKKIQESIDGALCKICVFAGLLGNLSKIEHDDSHSEEAKQGYPSDFAKLMNESIH